MPGTPTLVFVPGAWHTASTWDKVASLLKEQQYKSVSVTLPTTTSDPSKTLGDDVEAVRNAITAETTQGRDVVVVVHSYGGMVGPSAIKGLTPPKHDGSTTSTSKASGHVIGIASIASGFMPTGVSFIDGLGGKPPPLWRIDEESGYAVLAQEPGEAFYHDLAEDEAAYWVGKLQNQSLKAVLEGGEYVYAGWKDVPVWYLTTTEDRTHPTEVQNMIVQAARDQGADVTVREISSSHSPMLSKPKETVDFILDAVAAFVS